MELMEGTGEVISDEGMSVGHSTSCKRRHVAMFCDHCNEWVSKSTFYCHRRDYGSRSDTEEKDLSMEMITRESQMCIEEQVEKNDEFTEGNNKSIIP